MTAEIVIMNKQAIAIAADSAVTISHPTGPKIYNSVNKLFNLTIYSPVAAMIYGNAEIGGYPWETIIKEYRRHLGPERFARLFDYSDHFLTFLKALPFDTGHEQVAVASIAGDRVGSIIARLFDEITRAIETRRGRSRINTSSIVGRIVNEELNTARSISVAEGFEGVSIESFSQRFAVTVRQVCSEIVEGHFELSDEMTSSLMEIVYRYAVGDWQSQAVSGLVVAGFGDDEMLPSLRSIMIEGPIFGHLKVKPHQDQNVRHDNNVVIVPFAQSDMVGRFMEGIDTDYQRFLERLIAGFSAGLPEIMSNIHGKRSSGRQAKISELIAAKVQDLVQAARAHRYTNYVQPILSAVSTLPKNELASLAESLVQFTSLKRKMSTDLETVGEPIDVAVISKGDGFVWIRRKHYFDAALNPRFMQTYVDRYRSSTYNAAKGA